MIKFNIPIYVLLAIVGLGFGTFALLMQTGVLGTTITHPDTHTAECNITVYDHCYILPKDITTLSVDKHNVNCPVKVNDKCLAPTDNRTKQIQTDGIMA